LEATKISEKIKPKPIKNVILATTEDDVISSNSSCPNSEISKLTEKDDGITLEKEDKKRINATRTQFYSLNE
jgi:hypothetical protein